MKIYFDSDTEDLSQYTDEELRECGTYNRETESKPITLENFKLGLNSKGQVCISFDSVNHKYLDVEYAGFSSHRESDDGKNFPTHRLHLSSQSKYPFKDEKTGKKYFESPVSRKTISLEPDSEEESDLLHGTISILATKWSYCLTIVPYADLECIGEEIISIDKPDDTTIYGD